MEWNNFSNVGRGSPKKSGHCSRRCCLKKLLMDGWADGQADGQMEGRQTNIDQNSS